MEIKVCKNCRRLFKYIYGPELCPECSKLLSKEKDAMVQKNKELLQAVRPLVKEDEEKFEQIKEYIIAHPKATIVQISEENDVSPTKLLDWVREDRLEFSEDSQDAWFECAICGARIKSGRLCNRCKIKK